MASGLSWTDALEMYAYPANLRRFSGRDCFGPGWFERNIVSGDRQETILFENRFRAHAQSHLEAWYEVVFWKMASQGGRANYQTNAVIRRVMQKSISAEALWNHCYRYVSQETKEAFCGFQELLFASENIATACTFPAFACPEKFPMVDTRIARYVAFEAKRLRFREAPEIEKTLQRCRKNPKYLLTSWDWPFVQEWITWCRKAAQKLNTHSTGAGKVGWRARDVEMAVFRAWGEKHERTAEPEGPRFTLPVLA